MKNGIHHEMPFLVEAWLSSSHVEMMDNTQRGAFVMLLCRAWCAEDCCLPDDDETLRKWSRSTMDEWVEKGVRDMMKVVFTPVEGRSGRLGNERQLAIRAEQNRRIELAVERRKRFKNAHETPENGEVPKDGKEKAPKFIPPTEDEVLLLCAKIGLPEIEGRKFFNYWDEQGWKNKGGPVKDVSKRLVRWKLNWETSGRPGSKAPSEISIDELVAREWKNSL